MCSYHVVISGAGGAIDYVIGTSIVDDVLPWEKPMLVHVAGGGEGRRSCSMLPRAVLPQHVDGGASSVDSHGGGLLLVIRVVIVRKRHGSVGKKDTVT
jgi:hypothetical protein